MVVHEDNESSMEVGAIKKPLIERKSYVIVKNHVKELPKTQKSCSINENEFNDISVNNGAKKISRKTVKKHKKIEETVSNVPSASTQCTEIDSNDLNELRTTYIKCKEVIKKIEKKYGHLLDLDDSESGSSKSKKRHTDTPNCECQCIKKQKIIFDDEGKQSTVDMYTDIHICIDKLKNANDPQTRPNNIEVEYQDIEIDLPDNLKELYDILHDSSIEKTHRNKVLEKIRALKQEYNNEIKFNKPTLIEKLKSNCYEVLDFKGTNLSIITGYS